MIVNSNEGCDWLGVSPKLMDEGPFSSFAQAVGVKSLIYSLTHRFSGSLTHTGPLLLSPALVARKL